MNYNFSIWEILAIGIFLYFLTKFIFDVLLRGFSPFISSRPWVVKQLLYEIKNFEINNKPRFRVVSFNSGTSGFLHALEKAYPDAQYVGIEKHIYPFVVAKIQSLIRRTNIKVIKNRHFHRSDVSDADLIYSHISRTNVLRELGEKIKFESREGTIVMSNGFTVPALTPVKTLELLPGKGRFAFLSKDRKVLFAKRSFDKKENKVFIFKI